MEKILESDMIQTKREAAQKILELKLKVLIEGSQKRGKEKEAKEYVNKLKRLNSFTRVFHL